MARKKKGAGGYRIPMKGDDAAARLSLVTDTIRRAIRRKAEADKMLREAKESARKEGYSLPAILRALSYEKMTAGQVAERLEKEVQDRELAERYREIIADTPIEEAIKVADAADRQNAGEGDAGGAGGGAALFDADDPSAKVESAAGDPAPASAGGDAVPYGADPAAVKRAVRRDAAKAKAGGNAAARPAGRSRLSVVGNPASGEAVVY
ncbi:hypothetical protein [Oceanibaculum indicum]|uniref:Uncharacterized protein n=1 Tax=Oceanibaculum indicum P24 TaxID=1207063 RepID=K2J7J9_9PROT|nr:hypothetical protein [Oceanibaculum indicum]EKE70907.1 hypothetical protein P24_15229 [Oceanibaculum indicum P24]